MILLLTLALSVAAVFLLQEQIRKFPLAAYFVCVILSVVGMYLIMNPNPNLLLREWVSIFQKGYLAVSLFIMVMFIGVIPKSSKRGRKLVAIRSELSIMASILICAHLIPYLINYIAMLPFLLSLKTSVIFSLVVSLLLMLLLVPLAVTSIKVVKNMMKSNSWKRLQSLSYLFFGLIYFHLMGYLLVPLGEGSIDAAISIAVYTVIFLAYLVLRIKKGLADR